MLKNSFLQNATRQLFFFSFLCVGAGGGGGGREGVRMGSLSWIPVYICLCAFTSEMSYPDIGPCQFVTLLLNICYTPNQLSVCLFVVVLFSLVLGVFFIALDIYN